MDFSYILLSSVLDNSRLKKFGFKKTDGSWKISKDIPESDFFAEIILNENSLTAEVYEKSNHEKYVLFDVLSAHGKFIYEIRQKVQKIMEEIQNECFNSSDVKTKYVEFLKKQFNTEPDFPWSDLPEYGVFRCSNKKWFALIMKIKFKQLGIKSEENVWVVNLKAAAEKIPLIIDKKTVFPAYHMNKKYWITVLLTSVTDFEKLCFLTKESFELVLKK